MDESPLTRAHDHARAAAVATRQASDSTVAISEHTLAAGEFANATLHTTSVEALRTLKLLENHHQRLAVLLKLPPQTAAAVASAQSPVAGQHGSPNEKMSQPSETNKTSTVSGHGVAQAKDAQKLAVPPPLTGRSHPHRFASREMSSSIASNLATARGIRSKNRGQPLSPSISSDLAPGNVDPHPRRDGSRSKMQTIMDQTEKPTGALPSSSSTQQRSSVTREPSSKAEADSSAAAEEGGYARFYSTFGNLINKISAPLAFAGLPLIQEESSTSSGSARNASAPAHPSPRVKSGPSKSSISLDPDLSKIYSKATMKALSRDDYATSDSFYVVPTSGHTMSYANILTYAEKEKRRIGASVHSHMSSGPIDDDDDDFVDARESLASIPGALRRRAGGRGPGEGELRNNIEELSLENRSLKEMLDSVSKRLQAFEASSQHSAMALAESYRFMRPSSPGMTGGGGGGGGGAGGKSTTNDEALRRRAHEAEEQLAAASKQMERLERDNRKMQRTLDKYRDKWDALKAGAKARRDAQGGSGSGGGGGGGDGGSGGDSVEDARQG